MAIDQIQSRAVAIGLTLTELAAKAGVSASTPLRQSRGKTRGGWLETNKKLVAALLAEEQRVREHLAKVDPKPAPTTAAADGEAA